MEDLRIIMPQIQFAIDGKPHPETEKIIKSLVVDNTISTINSYVARQTNQLKINDDYMPNAFGYIPPPIDYGD